MNTPQLSFGGLGDATRSGSSLGSWSTGLQDVALNTGTTNTGANGGALSIGPIGGQTQNPVTGGGAGGGVGAQQQTGWFGEHGKMNTIIGGVQVLGSLWNSFQQHKMAKEQMAFAREQWDTNLENQTQTYNTALEDRIRSRHFTEGKDSGATDAYLNEHSL